MVSFLSIVDMIKALNRCDNDPDFIELWNAFVTMRDFGFISLDDWSSFREIADKLFFDGNMLSRD